MLKDVFLTSSTSENNHDNNINFIDDENLSFKTYLGGNGYKSTLQGIKESEKLFQGLIIN